MSGVRLPEPVRAAVEAALRDEGGVGAGRIADTAVVAGGCISPTTRVRTVAGLDFFLKWRGPDLPAGMLAAEARGLEALRSAGPVRVPAVIAVGQEPEWLLLEWLEPGAASPDFWQRLGRGMAALHRTRARRFGAEEDNFIGSLPQSNGWLESWADFWRTRRLEPQLRRAVDAGLVGDADRRRFDALFHALDGLLAPGTADGPSLLHGDLWSGNVHVLADGTAAVIDPAAYHGHREVDLAMADLFGGFGARFRTAYEEAWPLEPGYEPVRRPIYQLYYLLVHVNLFGAGYVEGTRAALGKAGF